jgi:hypothetical protein
VCLAATPLTALAQEPLAVKTLEGTLLVNGQDVEEGTILAGDSVLETLADGAALVELSDGSRFEIGGQTRLTVVKTVGTKTTTSILRLKLVQGWIRAKSEQEDQEIEGLIFDVETPNAIVGAKLAKSDIEVIYGEEQQETVGIAHGVELRAKNLLSGEERYIPKGSTVLIQAENMQVVEGIELAQSAKNPVSDFWGRVTKPTTLIVGGGLLAAGAVTAAMVNEEEVSNADFVGNFARTDTLEGSDVLYEQFSIEEGQISELTGFYRATRSGPNCQYEYTRDMTGSVDLNTAFLTLAPVTYTQQCQSGSAAVTLSKETWTCKLRDEKAVLRCTNRDGEVDYQRQ